MLTSVLVTLLARMDSAILIAVPQVFAGHLRRAGVLTRVFVGQLSTVQGFV